MYKKTKKWNIPKDFKNKNELRNSMTKIWNRGFIDQSSRMGTSIGRDVGGRRLFLNSDEILMLRSSIGVTNFNPINPGLRPESVLLIYRFLYARNIRLLYFGISQD